MFYTPVTAPITLENQNPRGFKTYGSVESTLELTINCTIIIIMRV